MPRTRLRIGLGAACVVVLVALAVAVLLGATSAAPSVSLLERPTGTPTRSSTLLVHVGGAVASPGVYALPGGARVVDAVAAASGLAQDADTDAVNLARLVVDGEHLYVPRLGEGAGGAGPGAAGSGGSSGSGAGRPAAKVDLNRATLADLETLPRVGPALAQRIVDRRTQHGPFTSIEDLRSVSGIGDATFAGLRDLVTV